MMKSHSSMVTAEQNKEEGRDGNKSDPWVGQR